MVHARGRDDCRSFKWNPHTLHRKYAIKVSFYDRQDANNPTKGATASDPEITRDSLMTDMLVSAITWGSGTAVKCAIGRVETEVALGRAGTSVALRCAANRAQGKAAENLEATLGSYSNRGRIVSMTRSAACREPDFLEHSLRRLVEVKHVKYVSLTKQIVDEALWHWSTITHMNCGWSVIPSSADR